MVRRVLLVVILLIAGAVLAGVFWPARKVEPGVSIENFRRLQYGMSEKEVIAILGEPARVVHHGPWSTYWWSSSGIDVRVVITDDTPSRSGVGTAEVTGAKRETLDRSSMKWQRWFGVVWDSIPLW